MPTNVLPSTLVVELMQNANFAIVSKLSLKPFLRISNTSGASKALLKLDS